MLELMNSMVRFSTAVAAFGIQQIRNVVSDPKSSVQSIGHVREAMDSAAAALTNGIDEKGKATVERVSNMGTDLVAKTAHAVEGSPLDPEHVVQATDSLTKAAKDTLNPLAFRTARTVIPPIARVLCSPAGYAEIGSIESTNKILTIETVEFTHLFLGKDDTLAQLIDKIQRYEPHRRLWLAEGLGQVFGNRVLEKSENPRNMLSEGEGAQIPDEFQLMVHAGMCLSFARHHYDKIGKNPTNTQVHDAVKRVAELAQNNLLRGYAGIGYEAWGMVTQFFYRQLFPQVHQAMQEIDPVHAPYLFHGAGRACYFIDFMPGWKEPWPAFKVVQNLAIDDVSRHNLLAGLAAGMMIVNMKTPKILESIIKERISRLPDDDADAFAQGVGCSMVMRMDTTPNESNALRFLEHKPAPDVAELWGKIAAGPSRLVLDKLYPKLKVQHRLDEITCYRPLDDLLASC